MYEIFIIAYAAPELIHGHSYLGAEADLWSMGVLLYALLCGTLPFDDDKIHILYKKIQEGRYEIPAHLSADSVTLLNDLLQLEPKKRIRMSQLVYHPWVLKGNPVPVDWRTLYYFDELDTECVNEIALYFNKEPKEIRDQIQLWQYDFLTATYLILLFMKMGGKSPRIKTAMKKYSRYINFNNCNASSLVESNNTMSNTINNSTNLSVASQHQNMNRVLVEKQLAAMNINSDTMPKIMNAVSTASPKVNMNTVRQHVTCHKQNMENLTPLKQSQQQQQATPNQQREARSKTKTTTPNSKPVQIANTIMPPPPKPIMMNNGGESTLSDQSSSSSSESLSNSSSYNSSNNSNNFVLPSRINKNIHKLVENYYFLIDGI